MEILDFRVYRGPNLYSYWPVIRMDVDLGDYYQVTSDEIADFNRQLINLLPGLKDHSCSRGYQGGFIERLQEGTYLGHVIEHVCLELQNLVDINVNYGSTRRAECEGKYHIIYSFEEEKPAVLAGRHALSIVDRVADQKPPDLDRRIRELKDALIETGLGPSTKALVAAARKRGIPTSRLEERSSLIRLGYGARQKRIQASITDNTSCVAVDSACDKWRTRKLLSKQGLPVPRGELVEKPEECMEFAEEIGVPVVTKPADQNQGKGVTLNLRGEDELGEAFHVARKYGSQVLVEENIPGDDYRLLVVDGEMVAASRKRPAQVTGDGEHSIRELIERENRDPRRGEGHEKPLTKIQVDEVVQLMLDRQELSLDTVPESGRDVLLREMET